MPIPYEFDFKAPDYLRAFDYRLERLRRIREANSAQLLSDLYGYYRENPAQFIIDWGCTTDPRNVANRLPAVLPMLLFPKQEELVNAIMRAWRAGDPLVIPKSREVGVSWTVIALACTICLFNDNTVIGFGSRKLELVDKLGDSDCLFWKAREFMALLPEEFRRGWTRRDAPEKLIKFTASGSIIKGEGGDDIGRGGRTSLYFVDEAAFLERPDGIEASLSQTTNCRVDLSSFNGPGNPFAEKVRSWPPEWVFRFHWRDDPRKDDEWYQRQVARLPAVVVAQEIDMDVNASVEGIVIPNAWVMAAIDAHVKLGTEPSGVRKAALDVADQGIDLNAYAGRYGILLEHVESWTGKQSDIFATTLKAMQLVDEYDHETLDYDADGLGSACRGDARIINADRKSEGKRAIEVNAYRGSGEVEKPDDPIPSATEELLKDRRERLNKDFFSNRKAQAWWGLRVRFEATYKAVTMGLPLDPDKLISISSTIACKDQLVSELSQATYQLNTAGKIVINKTPPGTRSPNLADAVVIVFAGAHKAPKGFFS